MKEPKALRKLKPTSKFHRVHEGKDKHPEDFLVHRNEGSPFKKFTNQTQKNAKIIISFSSVCNLHSYSHKQCSK